MRAFDLNVNPKKTAYKIRVHFHSGKCHQEWPLDDDNIISN
jgi:hypothetical protein